MRKLLSRDECRSVLISLLNLRKGEEYRKGLLQAAVSFGVITQDEWELVSMPVKFRHEKIPALAKGTP